MVYERFDIVAVPFPFSDKSQSKLRPVVILSGKKFNKSIRHVVTAMITTAKGSAWPLDVKINDLDSSGLPKECFIRMKLFTADESIIARKLGRLSSRDQNSLSKALAKLWI